MGSFGAQPARPLLQNYACGPQAARARSLELRPHAGGDPTRLASFGIINPIHRLFRQRPSRKHELAEELESHLEEKVDELMESGLSEREARAQACREFGNVMLYREVSR